MTIDRDSVLEAGTIHRIHRSHQCKKTVVVWVDFRHTLGKDVPITCRSSKHRRCSYFSFVNYSMEMWLNAVMGDVCAFSNGIGKITAYVWIKMLILPIVKLVLCCLWFWSMTKSHYDFRIEIRLKGAWPPCLLDDKTNFDMRHVISATFWARFCEVVAVRKPETVLAMLTWTWLSPA